MRPSFNVFILQLQKKLHFIWMHGESITLSWDKWGNQVQLHSKLEENGAVGTLAISSTFAYSFCLRIWRHLGKPGYKVGFQWHPIDSTSVDLERDEWWERIREIGRKNSCSVTFRQKIWYEAGWSDWNIKSAWGQIWPKLPWISFLALLCFCVLNCNLAMSKTMSTL